MSCNSALMCKRVLLTVIYPHCKNLSWCYRKRKTYHECSGRLTWSLGLLFVSDQTGLYNPGMDKLASIVQQLQQQRARIDAALRALTGATNHTGATRTGRRTLSAAARQRIAAAQRKRWAKFKAAKTGKPKA
jgi:hypothetical protein